MRLRFDLGSPEVAQAFIEELNALKLRGIRASTPSDEPPIDLSRIPRYQTAPAKNTTVLSASQADQRFAAGLVVVQKRRRPEKIDDAE